MKLSKIHSWVYANKNPKIPCNKFKMLIKILSGLCLTVVKVEVYVDK